QMQQPSFLCPSAELLLEDAPELVEGRVGEELPLLRFQILPDGEFDRGNFVELRADATGFLPAADETHGSRPGRQVERLPDLLAGERPFNVERAWAAAVGTG